MLFGLVLFEPSVNAINRRHTLFLQHFDAMDCIQSQNVNGISEEVNAMSLSFACEGSGNTDKENNDVAVQNRDVVDSKHQPILPSLKDSSRSTSRPSVTKAGAIAGGSSSSMVSTESKPSTLPENEKGATDTPTNAAKEMAPIIRTPKRQEYLSWEDFFMGVAVLSSKRSKDPISPTGACIVDKQQRIVGIGYNGFPRGCSDDVFPWTTGATNDDEDLPWLHTPEPYMCHAVTNAILNKCSHDVEGCSLYVTQYPCSDCAKMIIQSRISKVVVRKVEDSSTCLGCNSSLPLLNNEGNETTVDPDTRASQILLEMANVDVQYYRPTVKSLTIDFGKIENSVAMTESDVAKSACDTDEETMQQYGKIEEASPMLVKGDDDERTKIAHELLWEEARYDPRSSQNCKRRDYISWSEYFMVSFLKLHDCWQHCLEWNPFLVSQQQTSLLSTL